MKAQSLMPGATLGMLGGGQLGRMFVEAARRMGYACIVLDPDPLSPAGSIADAHIEAAYDDADALAELADRCDSVTTEFENVPANSLRILSQSIPVFPSANVIEIAQNRSREKNFARQAGLQTARFLDVAAPSDLDAVESTCGFPAVMKSATLGYDGKGQAIVHNLEEAQQAYVDLAATEYILEEKLILKQELSVLLVRNADGEVATFPIAENEHINGILHRSIVPARTSDALSEQARQLTERLADALDYQGVMAVEFFVTADDQLIFNEMAPRPHNSAHYTVDACLYSQFDQQVRAMAGLSPGSTQLLKPVVMVNLLGDLWDPNWSALFDNDCAKLHLYGKQEARLGRKMGHVNVLGDDLNELIADSDALFDRLS